MPSKPNEKVLKAASKELKPQDVLNAIVNDIPGLGEKLVAAGVAKEEK